MKEWLTINELAERTGIPDSTIRRYINKFDEFFVVKGGTRSKRYEDTSLQLLTRIKELYDKGYETEQTHAALLKEFPLVVNEVEEPTSQLPALATADDLAEIKAMLKAQQELSNRLLDRIAKQDEYIKNSLEHRDRALMQALSESLNKPLGHKENKSWWQKLFK